MALDEHRIALLDQRVIGEVGIRHERADAHAAVRASPRPSSSGSRVMSISRDGPFDILLHQVDQIGAAGDELRRRIGGDLAHRVGDVAWRARTAKLIMTASIACWIAATMLG